MMKMTVCPCQHREDDDTTRLANANVTRDNDIRGQRHGSMMMTATRANDDCDDARHEADEGGF